MSLAIPIALAVALAPPPAAVPPAAVPAQAFSALDRCLSTRQQQACSDADVELQQLIRTSEQPRCLSALTQLETHLAAFRWQLEGVSDLRIKLQQARQDCPAPASGRLR